VLKREGGFASQDAAKIAGREDAKKMKNMPQPDKVDVGRILVENIRRKPRGKNSQFVATKLRYLWAAVTKTSLVELASTSATNHSPEYAAYRDCRIKSAIPYGHPCIPCLVFP
jgi:hypothetical protein